MVRSIRTVHQQPTMQPSNPACVADQIAFHLARIGARLIAAGARLRESTDFEIGNQGLVEAQRDLERLLDVLAQIELDDPCRAETILSALAPPRASHPRDSLC